MEVIWSDVGLYVKKNQMFMQQYKLYTHAYIHVMINIYFVHILTEMYMYIHIHIPTCIYMYRA